MRKALITGCSCLLMSLVTATDRGNPNVRLPTLGGLQLWNDVQIKGTWRIQQHVWTGHHRVLDGWNMRRAWGSLEACQSVLQQRAPEAQRPRIVLLHGLGRTRYMWNTVEKVLRQEGHEVISLNYASRTASIDTHVAHVRGALQSLPGEGPITLITQSLGGILARRIAAEAADTNLEIEQIIMLFPPNQGSQAARLTYTLIAPRLFLGPTLKELRYPPETGEIPPSTKVHIVAGYTGKSGYNPLLTGDDDGIVTVEETALGDYERTMVKANHTFGMNHPEVLDLIRRECADLLPSSDAD